MTGDADVPTNMLQLLDATMGGLRLNLKLTAVLVTMLDTLLSGFASCRSTYSQAALLAT